jgi:hypothetical protein
MSEQRLIEGEVIFSNVETEDQYKGKPTGYNIVLRVSEADAAQMEDLGIKIKRYEDVPQRKFRTTYKPKVVNVEDDVVTGEVPFGSKVRLAYAIGDAHAEHGVPTYLNAVRVLERAASADMPEGF